LHFKRHRGRVWPLVIWALTLTFLVASPHVLVNVVSSADTSPAEQELAQQVPLAREIAGGTSQTYTLRLVAGQCFQLLVLRGDLKVSASLYDPQGQRLGEFSSNRYGALRITHVAQTAGLYRVRISSLEAAGEQGAYRLLLEEVRVATAQDRIIADANNAFYEAEKLRAAWTEPATRAAIQKYEGVLSGWQAANQSPEAIQALECLGDAYYTLGEYDQALRYYQAALALSRSRTDRAATARALNNIGYVYSYTGKDQQALSCFQAAFASLKKVRAAAFDAELRRIKARALCNIGEVYYSRGNLKQALTLFTEALDLWTEVGDRWGQALARLDSGHTIGDAGDTQKAAEQFEQALALWRSLGDVRGEALALSAMGGVHAFYGRKRQSLETYQQALKLFRRLGDRHGEAVALNGVARSYEEINELPTALDNYSQALALFQKNDSTEFEAVTEYCIGRIYRWLDQSDLARAHYQQSIRLSRKVGKQRIEAYALMDIATMQAAENTHNTLRQYEQILRLYRRIGDRRGQAQVLNCIGDIDYARRAGRLALKDYRRALPLYQTAKDSSGEADTFYNISRAARITENMRLALASTESAIKIIEALRVQIASPALRSSYFSSVRKYYGLYIDLLMQLHKEQPTAGFAAKAFQASESACARVLLETLTESEADLRQGVDPELLKRERALQQLLSAKALYQCQLLSNGSAEGEAGAVAREIRQLEAEYEDVQALIREQSPRYACVTQPQPPRLQDIQQELGDETLLLEYALGDERSYVWVVSSSNIVSAELGGRAALEQAAHDFYNILRARVPLLNETEEARATRVAEADSRYHQRATELSALLLGDIAGQLGKKRLLIVADGGLQYVPFEALPVPSAAEVANSRADAAEAGNSSVDLPPMVVEHEIVNLPSASLLVAIRHDQDHVRAPTGIVAVFADPVFETDDPRIKAPSAQAVKARTDSAAPSDTDELLSARGGIVHPARLPFTRREAAYILSLVPDGLGMMATGFDANLTRVRSPELSRYEIVHFATHGIFDDKQPALSGLLLSLVNEAGKPENGFLNLYDIYSLNLPVKLVVLSGCDTGLGKDVNGEGLVGLTHAFMYAGAKSVLASLWQVDDKATGELMRLFYTGLLRDGLPPAAALRAAKIAMWRRAPSQPPYYWAAFVFEGEYMQKISGVEYVQKPQHNSGLLLILVPALLLICWSGLRFSRQRRRRQLR
jgi:CHAT domain-containing protein/predicted negative regulator of RcsB-dependent stress response